VSFVDNASHIVFLILIICLIFSLAMNIILVLRLRRLKTSPKQSVDARQLLHDLTKGRAIVKIEILDPAELFYRSPKF